MLVELMSFKPLQSSYRSVCKILNVKLQQDYSYSYTFLEFGSLSQVFMYRLISLMITELLLEEDNGFKVIKKIKLLCQPMV